MWNSSWWLRSCGTTTRSSSSSPLRLLRPAQTVILKSTKGCTCSYDEGGWSHSHLCGDTKVLNVELLMREGGFFLVVLNQEEDLKVILDGFWCIRGHPLVLRRWTPDLQMEKESLCNLPIWVHFPGLPLRWWTVCGLSKLASLLGRPLHMDSLTAKRKRLHFARVCVLIDVKAVFPSEVSIMNEDGSCEAVTVEYEWKPTLCKECNSFGHGGGECRTGLKAPRKEWQPKQNSQRPVSKGSEALLYSTSQPNLQVVCMAVSGDEVSCMGGLQPKEGPPDNGNEHHDRQLNTFAALHDDVETSHGDVKHMQDMEGTPTLAGRPFLQHGKHVHPTKEGAANNLPIISSPQISSLNGGGDVAFVDGGDNGSRKDSSCTPNDIFASDLLGYPKAAKANTWHSTQASKEGLHQSINSRKEGNSTTSLQGGSAGREEGKATHHKEGATKEKNKGKEDLVQDQDSAIQGNRRGAANVSGISMQGNHVASLPDPPVCGMILGSKERVFINFMVTGFDKILIGVADHKI
ncbi:hypothetical protein Taro_036777 [Colocasia esculenta]|uniref:DUF4283 domain-containing protein n=1 Tax=Colocasia esculenta TaxID=4460 RepID=A0A843W7T3_COLES|nr:hypothetical protein [Colocasia esculenta]